MCVAPVTSTALPRYWDPLPQRISIHLVSTQHNKVQRKKKRSNVQREKKMECSTVASPTFDASAPFVRFIVLIDISFVRPIHKNNSIWNTVHHFRESIRIFLLVLDNEETQRQLSLHKDGRFLLLYLGFA
jgi:hypothetical protein